MSFSVLRGNLAAAVATGGTFAVNYPAGKTRGDFAFGVSHKLSVMGSLFTAPEDMTLSFGAASVTVTYNGATTIPAGAAFSLQLDAVGEANPVRDARTGKGKYVPAELAILNLGSPGVADADGILVSAAVTAAALKSTVLTGALVAAGVAVMDAPTGRNVVAAWTNTAILTVTGTDMYGNTLVESSASGTSFTGNKAFKTVTSIQFNADVTGCTVGSGTKVGLPVYVPNAAMIQAESLNGAAATAGTVAAGLAINTKPTATNGDVRGTYIPNSAADGSKAYELLVALEDPSSIGAEQYAG